MQDQGGDLAAMDAQLIHHQRGGRLVNPNGMTLDRALEGAQAEGYLGRQGGGANPIGINDLIDAIGGEARGNPVYRGADMAQANEAEAGQRATQQNQAWEEKVYQARDHVNVWNEQAGQQPLPKEVQDHAAQLVASGAHPEDAVRSAWRESEDRELQANATRNAVGSPGVPLAAQQATMDVEGGNRLTPNMTSENAANYTAANQATRDYKQRFAQGGVGNILRPGQNFQDFRTPEGNVPRQIFTGGNTEPAEVQHWIQAVGGVDQATPMARDVLANDLRTRRIIDPVSGQVNAGKLAQWMEARKATFEQLPQLRDEFANLHQNQEWLNDMVGKHTAAMKELQDTAAARFVGEDVPGAVRRALAGGPQAFGQLTRMIRGDPAAEAGLKRAMVNEIISRTKSLTPSSDGFDMMTPGGFRKFMDKYRDSLKPVFGGQGVNNLERVAAMMRRESEGTKAIAGSQTASHQARSRLSGIGAKVGHSGVTTALALLGDHLGEMIGGNGIAGAIGLAGGVAAKSVWDSMRQAAINTRSDLLREAMLHPDLASALMERADARGQISTMTQRRIAAALQGAVTSNVGTRH